VLKILLNIVFVCTVFASNSEVEKIPRSQLEAFIFKMGFESLLKDVQKDKNITLTNQAKIEIIQKEIQKNRQDLNYLLEQSNEQKVNKGMSLKVNNSDKISELKDINPKKSDDKDTIIKTQRKEIDSLKHDISILKSIVIKLKKEDDKRKKSKKKRLSLDDKLSKIATASKIKTKSKYKIAIVKRKKAKLRKKPFFGAVEIRDIFKGDKFEISRCDKFGWCKVANKKEYIPKFVLNFTK
jgi:hypothetical protein